MIAVIRFALALRAVEIVNNNSMSVSFTGGQVL